STFVGRSRFFLLETLTERLAAMLLEKFRLRSVTLKVTKPGALPGSTGVAVRITRKR
ncbi:MAG: dihydroneopterin aldolase, partial [Candidatus Omnitrophica bacterium]|nr:dihydroneopterin aldolase [Candidatus Omnitrophota bacterium]